ncbi:MAG: hypothetical protein ACPGOY_06900 [Rhodospirillaceae bacterium]
MTASNAVLGWPVHRDKFSLLSLGAFGASEEDPDYPASQLGTFPFSRVWRSATHAVGSIPTIELSVVFPTPVEANCFVLIAHNLSSAATWSWSFYSDAAMSDEIWTSGAAARVWGPMLLEQDCPWDGGNFWDRTLTSEGRAGRAWSHAVYAPGQTFARAAKVTISDPANTNGFIQAGGLEVAGLRRLPINPDLGAQNGHELRSEVTITESGRRHVRRLPAPAVFRGRCTQAPKDWALAGWAELVRNADLSVPFWWSLEPENHFHSLRLSWMAQIGEPSLLSWASGGAQGFPISLQEAIG